MSHSASEAQPVRRPFGFYLRVFGRLASLLNRKPPVPSGFAVLNMLFFHGFQIADAVAESVALLRLLPPSAHDTVEAVALAEAAATIADEVRRWETAARCLMDTHAKARRGVQAPDTAAVLDAIAATSPAAALR